MAETTGRRVRLRDTKPYEAPDSLDELRGPHDGTIDLPHAVRWQPDRFAVNVNEPGWRRMAYQALLAEGTAEEQRRLVNRTRLIETWPILTMDPRLRELWEDRFPELVESS
ncbi:MAG: transcriptional regulator [Propionibacteriaceae bacterium]|nr:transcriptional regulator [Propionibacteriaceae bacterium]